MKQFLRLFILASLVSLCAFPLRPSIAETKRALQQEDVSYVNANLYGPGLTATTLNAALAALGTTNQRTLFLAKGVWNLASNVTVPLNITLWIPSGTTVTINSSVTFTVHGPLIVDADNVTWHSGAGTFVWDYVCAGSANTVVTALGATPTTVAVNCTLSATANVTIPATVNLKFTYPGCLAPATGVTITHLGTIDALPTQKIFCPVGTGAVSFLNNFRVSSVHPEWWGCIADGVSDCLAPFQAAIVAVTNAGTISFPAAPEFGQGGVIQLESARYGLSGPLRLPRDVNVFSLRHVDIIGRGERLSELVGLASFPTGKGLIMWDETHPDWATGTPTVQVWQQHIEKIGFILPPVVDTYGIYYTIPPAGLSGTNPSNFGASRARLNMVGRDLFCTPDPHYNPGCFKIEGTCWSCHFENIRADTAYPGFLGSFPYQPQVFLITSKLNSEALETPYINSRFCTDGFGLQASYVVNVNAGERRVGPIGIFQGRAGLGTMFKHISASTGLQTIPAIDLVNSGCVYIEDLISEGNSIAPSLRIKDSSNITVRSIALGANDYRSGYPETGNNLSSAFWVEGSRFITVDGVPMDSISPHNAFGFAHCHCESGTDIGKKCTTATSPCSSTIGGVTCAGGAFCKPQDTRYLWSVARCTGGANNGLECASVCAGGTMAGITCYNDAECLGGGTCSAPDVACPGGTCNDTNQSCRYTNFNLADRWQTQIRLINPIPAGHYFEGHMANIPLAIQSIGIPPGTAYVDVTWNPGNIADGAATAVAVTVPRTNNFYGKPKATFSLSLPAGAVLFAEMNAVNTIGTSGTVYVTLFNKTGGALDLGSGTLHVEVSPR